MRPRLRLLFLLAALPLALSAQIVVSGSAGLLANPHQPHQLGRAAVKLGIALPPVPHLLLLWNVASVALDRQAGNNAPALGTSLEAWLSPARRPAESWGPLLLAEVAVGHRWGTGPHGYTALGLGAGWSLGNWVPYVEYRRRTFFHSGSVPDHQIVVGLKFILFG
ncbi:MAG: hypothetical protein ACRD1Y_14285 [Terriglobales bacterium]